MSRLPAGGLFLILPLLAAAQPLSFDYDTQKPLAVTTAGVEERDGVRIEDLSFANAGSGRTDAYLILHAGQAKTPGALFVHWYESKSPLSNRKQFLTEAIALAQHGLISLLVATPWSDPEWYSKRDVKRDFENSVQEIKELRRALDVLLSQPRVDPQRVAYIGHDFGAMYGIVAAAADRRVSAMALQAFTSGFSDWFLYNQDQLSAEGRRSVMERLAPLDPIRFIGQLDQTPVLMQFAQEDFYVPREKAEALYYAVQGRKRILWYDAGHGLNDPASEDRQKWLRETLRLD